MLNSLEMNDINNRSIIVDLQEGIQNRFSFQSSFDYISDSGRVKTKKLIMFLKLNTI